MADKPDRRENSLAGRVIVEVNKVNSTATLLVSPVAEAKLHAPPHVARAVKAVNAAKLFGQDAELSFVMDREAKRLVVRLVDKDTRQVIRQIPAEEVLRQAEELQ
jgi:flagellar protein FlaG